MANATCTLASQIELIRYDTEWVRADWQTSGGVMHQMTELHDSQIELSAVPEVYFPQLLCTE